jgi:hypothetical protein
MKRCFFALVCLGTAFACFADTLKPLNSKVMLPGNCFAGSRPDHKAPGGYGPSDNAPKVSRRKQVGKDETISLIALPEEVVPFGGTNRGFRLLLVNRTKSEVAFKATDSRLSLIREALDSNGQWRPIEYLPAVWCGNSYHRVFLPAQHYWEFITPVYTGTQKTKLRFVLQTKPPIYSNEFDGSINPEQFTNQ